MHYFQLITYRAWADIASEANKSYLGLLWWIIEPVMYMGVFYLVFAVGLRNQGADYVPFLLVALVTWKWISSSIMNASTMIVSNASLLKQIYLPKETLVLSSLLMNLYKYLVIQTLLLIFLAASGEVFASWALLPLVMLSGLALITGCGLLAGAMVPLLADLKRLVENGLLLVFFLSGIFFDISSLAPEARAVLQWNPFAVLISGYRDVLLHGQTPSTHTLLFPSACGIVFITFGLIVLRRLDRVYPKLL